MSQPPINTDLYFINPLIFDKYYKKEEDANKTEMLDDSAKIK